MISLVLNGQYAVFVLLVIALVVSLSFHEFGHAIVAKWQGDDTAQRAGRLTLNPISHLDPVGFLMVVFIGIGYAKPVPTDPRNFKSAVSDLYVAAAGPLMNLLTALVSWNIFLLLIKAGWQNPGGELFFTLLAQINLLLMVFNLIPLGPLDGHYILPHFLPKNLAYQYRVMNMRYGTAVFLGLIVASFMGLPLLEYLQKAALFMLNLITLVPLQLMSPRNNYLFATSTWFMAWGMQSVVFAWLVTIVLREPAELVGWAQTALLLPGMLFILLAGVLADRVGPDRQALYAQLAAAGVPWILIVALYAGWLSFPVMLIYAVLMGVMQAFVTPARDGLLNHVSGNKVQHTVLLTSLFQFGFQIVGYSIAAFADLVGAAVVLAMQSLCLLAGVLAYWRIRQSGIVENQPRTTDSVLDSVLQGARTVSGSPIMRTVVIQNVAMAMFFMGCFIVCFPLAVREVFNGSSSSLGLLNGLNSAGLALTIVVMLRIGYVKRAGRALLVAQALGSIVLMLSGSVESFTVFVVLVFCWGLCGGAAMPMSRTMMQELAPPSQRARVMSFYAFSFMGAGPIGTLFAGYLSELVGVQMAIQICGALMLTVVVLVGLTSPLWREDFEQAPAGVSQWRRV